MHLLTTPITWHPVSEGLPDAETNVLLGLRDRTSCEGFYDGHEDDGTPIFRDVCADQLDRDVVVYWANMPDAPPEPDSAAPLCSNCDTELPKGCGGVFKDDGDACALNRNSQGGAS